MINFFAYIVFKIKSISYQRKLFLSYFILIFLPLTALSVFFYVHTSSYQRSNFTNLSRLHLNQATTALETRIDEMLSLTRTLSMQKTLRTCLDKDPQELSMMEQANDLKEMESVINSYYFDSSIYQVRLYVNPNFKYADQNNTTWSMTNINTHFPDSGENIFKSPMLHGPFKLNTSFNNYISVFSLTMPIYSLENYDHTVGLICIDMFEDAVIDILRSTDYSKTGAVYLTDSSGNPLISYRSQTDDTVLHSEPIPAFQISEPAALSKDTLTVISPLIQGTWYLIVSSPTTFSAADRTTFYQLILAVCSIGVVIYLLAYLYARFNSGRILALSDTVRKIQQGDLSAHCTVDSYDEIGDLQVNINEMSAQIQNLLSEQYNMGIQLKNSELELLQAQINPHFLYNTLNLIKHTAQTGSADEVADLVDKLSAFYRISLSNGLNLISIRDELTHVRLYVELQNKRFNHTIHLEIYVAPEVEHLHILKLLLQPLIENSIAHGLQNKPGMIKIHISKDIRSLLISIVDNGCGITTEKLTKIKFIQKLGIRSSCANGYGLVNIHERLINYYGAESRMDIFSQVGIGTTIEIRLPLEKVS